MSRTKKHVTIKIPANDGYFGITYESRDINICNEFEDSSQKALQKIYQGDNASFVIRSLDAFHNRQYQNVNLITFRKNTELSEPRTVYEVKKAGDTYYLATGLYIGYINVDGVRIEINTGYHDCLLKRMLNVANNIFFDNSSDENMRENHMDNLLSVVLEYLFLTNFKAAFALGVPSEYRTVTEHGFNVKGKIDVNRYIRKDMYMGYKLTYSYKQRELSQDVIDVLYLAMNSLMSSKEKKNLLAGDYAKYYRQLKQLYSGKHISRNTLKNIEKDKSLNNPMYSKYKNALKYARYILELKNLVYDDSSEKNGSPGFLLDISELWEVYLAKLLSVRFSDYRVDSQVTLDLYPDTFYRRGNYPDIVIEAEDSIAVIDAKFKRMRFKNKDVDRNDLFQIHSYAGYYKSLNTKPVKFCSLVYPSVDEPGEKQTDAMLYGLENSETRFSIGYLKVGKNFAEMIQNENEFLNRMQRLFE